MHLWHLDNYLANVGLLLSQAGLQACLAPLQAETLLMMSRVISTQENCGLIEAGSGTATRVGSMSTRDLRLPGVVQSTRVIRWLCQA